METRKTGTLLFDAGDTLTLYANGKLYIVDRPNEVVVTEADGGVSRKATKGTLWGRNRAIVLEYGAPGVTGFDIRTGHLADTMKINEALGGRPVYDLFSTQDGSVWIMAYDQAFAGYVLFRVPPDGAVSLLRDTAGIPWDNHQFTQAPRSVLMDRHGVVWFSSPSVGIFYLKDGVVRQFDQRVENSPAASGMLYEDRNGVIYAADTTGLYAYNNGASLTGAAPATPIPIATPGAPVWRCGSEEGNRLYRAWQAGGLVMYVSRGGSALTAVKPEDGQARFSIALSRDDAEQTWVTTGSKTGELTVCLKDRILTVDAGTGVILRTLKCKRDHRIAPIAVSDSYILADRYRGSSISRVQPTGDAAWTSGLPGYVMTHPTAFGPYLLCQTRQGSYGGQATCGVDSNTGETLWNDVVNAYGAGTAFADDATYCVETDTFLAPDTTEAWVIARHPATGRRLWHYRRSGTTVGQAPLMDRVTDRVYVALDNGTIVCLDGLTGDPVWEKVLPQPPAKAPAASYEPYTSCMSLSANVLTVVTADQLLYLLHAGDGEVLHRIVVTEDIIRHGKRTGSPKLIAGPWIVGTLLVVPTENGMVAYILNGLRK